MFSVSTRTQYGIRALVRLAVAKDKDISASEIATMEGISAKYLEGILALLKASGLVLSQRGKNGGYRLAREASQIRMLDVVIALDGKIEPVQCVTPSCCAKAPNCLPRRFWDGLKRRIDDYLGETSLDDLLTGN